MANSFTTLLTWLRGEEVGQDDFGNRYYQDRKRSRLHGRVRRWVVYKSGEQAAHIPPLYHAWLHHTREHFPTPDESRDSQLPSSYNPRGSIAVPAEDSGQVRRPAAGDYQPWRP